jgi:hypothetical protein
MIKSTKELIYDARNGEKKAVIQIEIASWITNQDGVTYTINDYAVFQDSSKQLINTKEVNYRPEQINEMALIVISSSNFTGLSRTEAEWLKVKIALLFVTQQLPVYGSTATDWELTQ